MFPISNAADLNYYSTVDLFKVACFVKKVYDVCKMGSIKGAMTLSITTLSIMALSIMGLFATLSINDKRPSA
jgi:hypothetical protein